MHKHTQVRKHTNGVVEGTEAKGETIPWSSINKIINEEAILHSAVLNGRHNVAP